ncbi:hypothetical protein [Vibrio phage phiKT1028]|nr:hypothetical protein [Vibrio phage phiKT1028]
MAEKRNRKAAEKVWLDLMKEITEGGYNHTVYSQLFKEMNDEQFEEFINKIEAGGQLSVWVDNHNPKEYPVYDKLLESCRKRGLVIEQHLVFYDQDTGLEYETPETFVVGTAETRKQRQMWVKKFGAAKDDTKIDDLTGQVFGDSRGTGISIPEVRVLKTLGLDLMARELYDVKGGDLGALDEYRRSIQETGQATVRGSLRRGTGVRSLMTAGILMRGRHLENNVGERERED